MRTASELLGSDRDALVPLSATLVARPVRLCVFVPLYPDLPWEASVEHALACQARYWGGHANLVVPMFDGLAADEVFWRVIRQYDPDVIALHAPTVGDVEEIAPARYEEAISGLRSSLTRDGFDAARIDEYVREAQSELFWSRRPPLRSRRGAGEVDGPIPPPKRPPLDPRERIGVDRS